MTMEYRNDLITYRLNEDGANAAFIDNRTGTNWIVPSPVAFIRLNGRSLPSTAAARDGDDIVLRFAGADALARIRLIAKSRYLVLRVIEMQGAEVDEFTFADIRLRLSAQPAEPFAATALALNLQTQVLEIPSPLTRLRATCCRRFGFAGAALAIIGCPSRDLRPILQEAVAEAPDLPTSPLGGPWAADAPINRGSYLFNFDGITEKNVDDWIALAKSIGFTQIDFHGGRSHRFGDCRPNPLLYPEGRKSLKAVIDRLHDAGIAAGLHTYAFFIAKDCPWVTPVPDRRLGTDALFTLAADLTAEATELPMHESTAGMSTVTGFFVRNSITLRIDDELVTYGGIQSAPPYGFTACKRGAHGTRAAAHARGAEVYHLKECFGLFAPDGDSDLLAEVAACTAATFNECGFDMIYLDALDGEDIFAGLEYGWHYGSKFVFEIWKHLKKPALQEMSTFHHHLWNVRSRMGAWDHPTRAHKRFIDNHCDSNDYNARMFLPGHLGWWSFLTWKGPQQEPTYADDMEYLCCKALGTDTGFALMGIVPGAAAASPAIRRLAEMVRTYEELRHSGQVPERIKARLRERGKEFTLVPARGGGGQWKFRPAVVDRHKVEGRDERTLAWQVRNPFAPQPLRLRIEALLSVAPYDAPGGLVLADFATPEVLTDREAAEGVEVDLRRSDEPAPFGAGGGGRLAVSNDRAPRNAAWARAGRVFAPPLNLTSVAAGIHVEGQAKIESGGKRRGFGLWVHGDGQGELLNFQVRSPVAVSGAVEDHYIDIDFTGWRYFELVEPEGARVQDFRWPYERSHLAGSATEDIQEHAPVPHWFSGAYQIYRESTDHARIETFGLWINNLPPGCQTVCRLSPLKALPLVDACLVNPVVTLNGQELLFPVEIRAGQYVECLSATDCRLFGADGALLRRFRPRGRIPKLASGDNAVRFACASMPDGVAPRARVTAMLQGRALR